MLLLLLQGLLAEAVIYIALACIVPARRSLARALFPPYLFGFGQSEREKKKEAANDGRGTGNEEASDREDTSIWSYLRVHICSSNVISAASVAGLLA